MMHLAPKKRPKLEEYVLPNEMTQGNDGQIKHTVNIDADARKIYLQVRANFATLASLVWATSNVTRGNDYRPATWAKPLRMQLRIASAYFDTVYFEDGLWRERTRARSGLDWS